MFIGQPPRRVIGAGIGTRGGSTLLYPEVKPICAATPRLYGLILSGQALATALLLQKHLLVSLLKSRLNLRMIIGPNTGRRVAASAQEPQTFFLLHILAPVRTTTRLQGTFVSVPRTDPIWSAARQCLEQNALKRERMVARPYRLVWGISMLSLADGSVMVMTPNPRPTDWNGLRENKSL